MSVTYFIDTMIISVQKITETTPRTLSWLSATPPEPSKISWIVYSGLVPMSP